MLAGTLSSFFGFGQPRDSDKHKATGATAFAAPVIPTSEVADLRARLAELDQALEQLQARDG